MHVLMDYFVNVAQEECLDFPPVSILLFTL